MHELDRGERSVEESEARLRAFTDRVTQQEFTKRFKFMKSKGALGVFLDLNMYILNVKKVREPAILLMDHADLHMCSSKPPTPRLHEKFSRNIPSARRFHFLKYHSSLERLSIPSQISQLPYPGSSFKQSERRSYL